MQGEDPPDNFINYSVLYILSNMLRKCIITETYDNAITDHIYSLFKEGWKLDPWLHSNGRPWTVPNYRDGGPSGQYVWNLVRFEDNDPLPAMDTLTDFQVWLVCNSPVIQIPPVKIDTPSFEDPIVAEELVPHSETVTWVALGYEAPEKLVWAKNRLVRLRASVATDLMSNGLSKITENLLGAMDPDNIVIYLKSIGKLKDAVPIGPT